MYIARRDRPTSLPSSNLFMLTPRDVFTPGKLPLGDTMVYASRGTSDQEFAEALDNGFIPIVFGGFGVGKTSLARHGLRMVEAEGRLVNVPNVAGLSMGDVLQHCLETVGYTVTRARESESTISIKAKVGSELGFTAPVSAKLSSEIEGGRELKESVTEEFVVSSPTDIRVIKICDQHRLVILLDELHHADAGFIEDLSRFLKAYKNTNAEGLRLVLVGTASDPDRLVTRDPGIDRLIAEIPLGPMTEAEAKYVVDKGMADLAISVDEEVVTRIVRAAAGAPNTVQYLCLEVALQAFGEQLRHATIEHYYAALKKYTKSRLRRQHEKYHRAIEHTGEKRYRKQILHAMASVSDEYVTLDQIRVRVSRSIGEEVPSTTLSGPLRDLRQPKYGSILRDLKHEDVDGEGGERRVYNLTTFADPAMKDFIRMLDSGELDRVLDEFEPIEGDVVTEDGAAE